MARIEISGFRKTFGELEIIPGVDLTIEDKDFVVFVGPSGCGKSTMLRLIAGLETPTAGKIEIDGVDVTNTPPSRRGLAMVFQSYALYPHMSVRGNMEFGLRMAKLPKPEIAERVARAADILGLTPMLDRRPGQMSGGQRQRVAIGRAIVRDPRAFLFDEPLSNLDAALRVQMRLEIARLHEELGATTIYVTHDQVEAMTMATRIVVLNGGRIEQAGSPLELYHHPANRFVAQFIGSPKMNVVPVAVAGATDAGLRVAPPGGSEIVVPVEGAADSGVPGFTLGARPEQISLTDKGGMPAEVKVVEHLGNTTLAYVELDDGEMLTAALDGSSPVRVHDKVQLAIDVDAAHLFDPAGQALAKRDRHPLVSPGSTGG